MADHECSEEARITRNEKDIQDMWKIIESLRKGYLPLWATFLLMALSSICTGLIVKVVVM